MSESLKDFLQSYVEFSLFSAEELSELQEGYDDIIEVDEELGISALPEFTKSLNILKAHDLLNKDRLVHAFKCYQLTSLYEQLQALEELSLLDEESATLLLHKNDSVLFPLLFTQALEHQLLSTKVLEMISDDSLSAVRLELLSFIEQKGINSQLLFKQAFQSENPLSVLMSVELLEKVKELDAVDKHLKELTHFLSIALVVELLASINRQEKMSYEVIYKIACCDRPIAEKVGNLLLFCEGQCALDKNALMEESKATLVASLLWLAKTAKTAADYSANAKLWQQLECCQIVLSKEEQKVLQEALYLSEAHAAFLHQQFLTKPMSLVRDVPKFLFKTGVYIFSSFYQHIDLVIKPQSTSLNLGLIDFGLDTTPKSNLLKEASRYLETQSSMLAYPKGDFSESKYLPLPYDRFSPSEVARQKLLKQGQEAANAFFARKTQQEGRLASTSFFKPLPLEGQPTHLKLEEEKSDSEDEQPLNQLQ